VAPPGISLPRSARSSLSQLDACDYPPLTRCWLEIRVARGAKESVGGVTMERGGPSKAGPLMHVYAVCLKEAEASRSMRPPGPGYLRVTGIGARGSSNSRLCERR
jgi:hypothetical protein